jgi:nicotinamidase-related amidase
MEPMAADSVVFEDSSYIVDAGVISVHRSPVEDHDFPDVFCQNRAPPPLLSKSESSSSSMMHELFAAADFPSLPGEHHEDLHQVDDQEAASRVMNTNVSAITDEASPVAEPPPPPPPQQQKGRTKTLSTSLQELVRRGLSKRTDFPLVPSKAALLIIDVQEYCCSTPSPDYYHQQALPRMLQNIQLLLPAFRKHRDESSYGCEVIFTMIQAQTKDGRDISLDYKLSGTWFDNIPTIETPHDEIFLETVRPDTTSGKGDIVVPKTACSVFNSTNLQYLLRNLMVEQLIVCGQFTEQCVQSAVRDAADLGYFVTVVEDACAAQSLDRHTRGLQGVEGFSRILSTRQLLEELEEEPAIPSSTEYLDSKNLETTIPAVDLIIASENGGGDHVQ